MAKKFPDLTGDGKVTQADVLKGRGVFVSGSEVDGYASLLNEFELSESKAKTKEELQQVKERRKAYIGDLESNAELQRAFDAKYKRVLIKDEDGSSRYYHVPRDAMAMGSLMVSPEREMYGKGRLVKKLIESFKSKKYDSPRVEEGQSIDDEAFEELLSTPNKDALFFSKEELKELKKEVPEADAYSEMIAEFAMTREIDDEIIKKGEALGYNRKKIKSILEGKQSGIDQLRADFNKLTEKQLSEAEDNAARDAMAMGSLMVSPEREAYGKGKLVDRLIRALSKRQSDEIPETLGQQVDDGIVWKPEGEKVIKKYIERAKEAIKIPPKGRKIYERPFIQRPYISMTEGRSGTQILLQEDIPEGSEAFRQKFVTTWRRDGKTFTHNGEKYVVSKGESERAEKNMGSLMVAPERETYGKGKLVKKALKALDGDDAPKGKIKTLKDGTKIDTEIQEEVRQFIGKLKTVDADDRKYRDDALTAQQLEDYLYDFINEVPEKRADGSLMEPGLHSLGRTGYDLTSRFEFFGALDDAVESMVEANAGPVLDKKSRRKLQNRMFMEGRRELEAEEKIEKAKRKEARKARRAEARERAKENEGSLMMPLQREQKGKGKLIKEATPKIVDIFDRLVGPKTVDKKKQMVSEEQALREIQKTVDKNPQALEMLSDDDYMEVISRLPQQQRANFGFDDVPVDDPDDILQMLMDMEPEDVAQNLQLFPSMETMFEYAESLDAKDARKFMNALSPEDKEIFAGELPEFELGPREVKAHGGSSGVAILMPVDYEEPPKDTYNNISSKEEKEEVENMNSDGEMEEEYIDYVADQVLSQEEQDYLFKALDKDDKLEKILDKVMLNATEFTGSGEVDGPGTGVSDSIPARLSDGEFVFTRKATDQIGADKLQKMMDDAEREFDQRNGKANGGKAGTNPFVNPEEIYGVPKDGEEDIERQMLYSSRMPSLMNR